MGGPDDIVLNLEILPNKLAAIGIIGMNTTHKGGTVNDRVGHFCLEIVFVLNGIEEIKLAVRLANHIGITPMLEISHHGTANQALVPRDIYFFGTFQNCLQSRDNRGRNPLKIRSYLGKPDSCIIKTTRHFR